MKLHLKIKTTLFFVGLLLCSFTAVGRGVTGVVSDANGVVIGASVIIEGTNIGAATGADGRYELSVNSDSDVLIFSYLGMEDVKKVVGKQTTIDVLLKESSQQMEELVVVGYGVQKKSHLTGSITKFDTESIVDIPTADISTSLQGRLAGVNISNQSGEVGVAPKINIRGGGTLNDGGSPLIVVDNFVMEDGLSMVNASDIESIEVLKDASSAAIYGSRAANGVIMVTTKQGAHMKPIYSIKYSASFKQPYKLHELLSPGEYTEYVMYERDNYGGIAVHDWDLTAYYLEQNLGKRDWQEYGLQDNPMTHNLQFSISNARANMRYAISGGYITDDGLSEQNSVDKFNFRSRVDIKLSDYVDVGTSLSAAYVSTERPTASFLNYTMYHQYMPIYHNEFTSSITGVPVGEYAHPRDFSVDYDLSSVGGSSHVVNSKPFNSNNNSPYFVSQKTSKKYDTYQMVGNAYVNVKILPYLTFRTSNGVNIRYSSVDTFRASDAVAPGDDAVGTFSSTLRSNFSTDNTLTFDKSYGSHDINIMAGASAEMTKVKVAEMRGIGYPTDYIPWLGAATSFDPDGTGVNMRPKESLSSFFGRVNYAFKDRYLISGVFRADGYSLFGSNNKWGYFPSVSAGWRVSEEEFLKYNRVISSLKLRAGYGMTGDNNLEPLATADLLNSALYSIGGGTGEIVPGLSNSNSWIANPNLGWAKISELNVGVDLSVLKNRINTTMDYYYSTTRDMLFLRPASLTSGHEEYWTNDGKIRNKGFEFSIDSWNIRKRDFQWNTQFNIAFDRNRLLSLGGEEQIIKTSNSTRESYVNIVGEKAIQFYGYKTDGVWTSANEISQSGLTITGNDAVPGGLKVVDTNGDTIINEKDMTVIGDPYHDFSWGLTNTFMYKNFDLSILVQGEQGGEMINGDGHYNDFKERKPEYGLYNRWVSESHIGDGQTPMHVSGAINWMYTDYVVEDASYVAFRNITLGYTFSKNVVQKLKLQGLRLYAMVDNLLYFTPNGYRGINPEARQTYDFYNDTLVSGYQRGALPVATTFTVGVDLKF